MADRELAFESVLSARRAERRTALIVFPVVLALACLIGFAAVAISRQSSLSAQLRTARAQVDEANRTVDQRDQELRQARADAAALEQPGQGAAVLAPAGRGGGSAVVFAHPEQHALNVYAYGLDTPPEGQAYRLIVTDGAGHEAMVGPALQPDDRGTAHLLARDVPEGAARVELALVPASAAAAGARGAAAQGTGSGAPPPAQAAPAQRTPVLAGDLPRTGETGVVAATHRAQGRRGG